MKTMSKRLEADSVSGGKYWEVEVEGNEFRVRFGKLGQEKDWSVKSFATNEEAMKEAEKKMKSKLKKGYAEVDSNQLDDASSIELISFDDANDRQGGTLSTTFYGGFGSVLYIDGDLNLEGDFLTEAKNLVEGEFDLIVITGNLKVLGRIQLYDYTPALRVLGETHAETLEGGDCEIYVGRTFLDYFIYGYYNDGILEAGETSVPYFINSDHHLVAEAPDAITIDNYGSEGKYSGEGITKTFVEGVVEDDEINVDRFYEYLKAGKAVMK